MPTKVGARRNIKTKTDSRSSDPISYKAEPVDFAKDYDADYYINNQIVPAAIRVLSVLGVTEDELRGEGKQTGLAGFSPGSAEGSQSPCQHKGKKGRCRKKRKRKI